MKALSVGSFCLKTQKKNYFPFFVDKGFAPAYNTGRKEGVPHTKERGKEKGEPKQLQQEKSVKGKSIMKRTPKRTPKRSALPQKMTALFLTLVLLLPLFCFGMYTFAEETEPEILYEDMSKRSETEKHLSIGF